MIKTTFTRLAGSGIKRMRPIFKTKMLIYHSVANLDEKILFGKITHHLGPEMGEMMVKGKFGNKDSTFHSGPRFTCY